EANKSVAVLITAPGAGLIISSLTANPSSGTSPVTVTVSDTASTPDLTDAVSGTIDWGDGTVTTLSGITVGSGGSITIPASEETHTYNLAAAAQPVTAIVLDLKQNGQDANKSAAVSIVAATSAPLDVDGNGMIDPVT